MTEPALLLSVGAAAALIALLFALHALRGARARLQQQEQAAKLRADQLIEEREQVRDQLQQARQELKSERVARNRLRLEHTRLEAVHEASTRAADEKMLLLQSAREQLKLEFNELANRIFEEKSARLSDHTRESVEQSLNPLRTALQDFRRRVDEVHTRDNRDRASLQTELQQLKNLNQQMSEEALNLTRALKGDKKAQGNWGEVILERVLEHSGLQKGREYQTQVNLRDSGGARRLPDVVVHLPEQRDIVIDAKVSLVDYESYMNADDPLEREAALKRHALALRNHIGNLSGKKYDQLPGLQSPDFVLLFVPIEAAFLAAFEADSGLLQTAYEHHVIPVSPTTLLATLKTVQTLWRYDQQNRNAEEIAGQAGGIYDQFALVLEAMDDLGRTLRRTQDAFETVDRRLTSGRGNLVRRVEGLKELGARTRKELPGQYAGRIGDGLKIVDSNED